MQPVIDEISESTQRMLYGVADQSLLVEAQDTWAARIIEELFRGWYLRPANALLESSRAPEMVVKTGVQPPAIPRTWPQFEIAGGGVCFTDGRTLYIDIEGSVVAIDKPDNPAVELWTNGRLELSPSLTRLVTYALSAALRRRRLFELHSGAVVDPKSGRGVLIIGPSGSGKSTLTVQLATAGWPFLTDDVLLLSTTDNEVKAWPLRRTFAITAQTFSASRFLQSQTSLDQLPSQPGDKKQFVPHVVFEEQFRENCIPQSLFFSELSGRDQSHVTRLSSAETMARLIRISPWSCYDRATASDHLGVLSALTKQCQGYSLCAGRDLLDSECAANLVASHMRD